jgi:hypothetical protein
MPPQVEAVGSWRFVVDLLAVGGVLFAFLFSLTMIAIGGYYLLRVAQGAFGGLSGSAARERADGADQARRLALLSLICGPLLTMGLTLIFLPLLVITGGFLKSLLALLISLAVGLGAGLISGGAFLVTARLLGPVRKQIRKWRRGKAWDPDFDGIV